MNHKSLRILYLTIGLTFTINIASSQEGTVTVNQDEKITTLLNLKKQINVDDADNGRYKIQIYSGDRQRAETKEKTFKSIYYQWRTKLVYETPNYKIWVGSFRTRLEADRALLKVKKKFQSAFVFKHKKKD